MNKWIFFSLIFILASCDSSKKTTDSGAKNNKSKIAETTKCKVPGIVKDFTGLDGCRFLIEVENGEKWLPIITIETSFQMEDGLAILFGYKEVEDAISVCMAESKTVEITCIKRLPDNADKPIVPKCYDISDPMSVDWMKKMITEQKVTKIMKYNFRDGWAYMLFSRDKRSLYDCQGTNLCSAGKGETKDCFSRYLPLLSGNKEIYSEGPDE